MDSQDVFETLRRINQAWLAGKPSDMEPLIHPDIVMVFPGFAGRGSGRPAMIAEFESFCQNAHTVSFEESKHEVDVVGDTAVASYCFDMVFELQGVRTHSTGRDVWVFHRTAGGWQAVWRTMLDVGEQPV